MKRANGKPIVARRNPFVVAACMRKAGSHRKTNKALRRQENQRHWGHNSMVE